MREVPESNAVIVLCILLLVPGSMVMGSPGKVRRPLTPEEDASLDKYASSYVKYRLDYMPSTVTAS